MSLAARLDAIGPDDVVDALRQERLVAFYGPRGTVMMAPPDDLPVLTIGTAPADEASLRAALPGAFLRHLDAAGVAAADALSTVIDAVRRVLASGPRPRGETAMAVTAALPRSLTPPCRGRCPDPHVEDSLFRLAGVHGAMRFHRCDDVLVAVESGPAAPPAVLRAQFVRRYLSCYGPSTPTALAAWAGIGQADAKRSMDALREELVQVTVDGRAAGVLLEQDGPGAATVVHSVRLVPPFDPFLLDRDRDLLVPDRAAQRVVWRASGNPGVVVVNGEPVATWRTRKRSGRSDVLVDPLEPASPVDPATVADEIARLRLLVNRPSNLS